MVESVPLPKLVNYKKDVEITVESCHCKSYQIWFSEFFVVNDVYIGWYFLDLIILISNLEVFVKYSNSKL